MPEQSLSALPASVTTVVPGQPISGPAAVPKLVVQQIALALPDRLAEPGGPVELALDPPELGRVRLQVVELAGVLTLTIQAERPETADLMRRHLDLLAQEFADAGVGEASVHISRDGNRPGDEATREQDPDASLGPAFGEEPPTDGTARPSLTVLDLRL